MFVLSLSTTRKKSIVQTKKAKDAISYNDFSPVETTQHENPPFLPGFFVLKAAINETVVARYVSDVSGFDSTFIFGPKLNIEIPFLDFSREQFEREFVYQQRVHWKMLNTWQCYRSVRYQLVTLKSFRFSRQQKIHMTFGMIAHLSYYCKFVMLQINRINQFHLHTLH